MKQVPVQEQQETKEEPTAPPRKLKAVDMDYDQLDVTTDAQGNQKGGADTDEMKVFLSEIRQKQAEYEAQSRWGESKEASLQAEVASFVRERGPSGVVIALESMPHLSVKARLSALFTWLDQSDGNTMLASKRSTGVIRFSTSTS